MFNSAHRFFRTALGVALAAALAAPVAASDFSEPWKRPDRALVVDAYEYNSIDWQELSTDKRIVGFINKASDGLPPEYFCSGNVTEFRLCKALWKRHAVARELFQTRKVVAKALGLKWGAYHLARPGNPIEQANNFVDFAEPGPDDLMALDIEANDPEKWMSLADAEEFARHVHRRVGRFPLLYTNGVTATYIAANRQRYPLLSRLPLWYARYKPEIGIHFPKGNWKRYALWQFSAQANCNAKSCPYRVPGTPTDIDVNVASMDSDELRAAWPFGGLVDSSVDLIASVPLPISRQAALSGDVALQFAEVERPVEVAAFDAMLADEDKNPVSVSLGGPVDALTDMIASVPVPISRHAALKGAVALQFAPVEGPVEVAAFDSMLADEDKNPVSVSLGGEARPLGREAVETYLASIKRTRHVVRAIEARYADAPAKPYLISSAQPVHASSLARYDLPVFLLTMSSGRLSQDFKHPY